MQQLRRDVGLSPPSSAEIKNKWIVPVRAMLVLYADGDNCTAYVQFRPSVHLSVYIEFSVAVACENVPMKHEFHENLCSESRTAPTGVNEFWSLYSTFSI